jgi:iron-sulfur cluster repair protein YtfE (RIC family)
MAEDLTVQLLSIQQSGTRELAQIAVMRKQHEMETAVVDMIDEVTSSAPPPAPPGTGRVVDRQA